MANCSLCCDQSRSLITGKNGELATQHLNEVHRWDPARSPNLGTKHNDGARLHCSSFRPCRRNLPFRRTSSPTMPLHTAARTAALALAVGLALGTDRAPPAADAPPAPAAVEYLTPGDLLVDPAAVTASGISSGADFVVQLQVAYSSVFAGIGVFAGQSYHCAVHRFPADAVVPANSTKDARNIPYCDGCPPGDTLAVYDHCKVHPDRTADPAPLVAYARAQSAAGTIDDLGNLTTASGSERKNKRVYLYRGTDDTTYNRGAVNATANFFRALLPGGGAGPDVFFETHINSTHLLPGIDPYLCWWEEWDGPDNCTYDGARAVLEWVYGTAALAGGRRNDTAALGRQLRPLAQRPFFPADGRAPLMAGDALVFAPPHCLAPGSSVGGGAGGGLCKLHLFFHGCSVEPTYPVFSQFGGFLEWAADNNIIVVFPKMDHNASFPFSQERSGCWDGYGQTGHDYDLRNGSQMLTIANMVRALINGTVPGEQ